MPADGGGDDVAGEPPVRVFAVLDGRRIRVPASALQAPSLKDVHAAVEAAFELDDGDFALATTSEAPDFEVRLQSELDELLNECGFGSPTVTTVLSVRNRALPFSFLLRSSDVV